MSILEKIHFIGFPRNKYFREPVPKKQIVLHHTVSRGTALDVVNFWKSSKYPVATAFIIDRDGAIVQLFNSRFWAYHIGNIKKELKQFNLRPYNASKFSIGIELVNIGGLKKDGSKLVDAYGKIWKGDFIFYKEAFRGYHYFEPYTEKQIESVIELINFLAAKYQIPVSYSEDIFTLSKKALSGKKGLFSHVSFRLDKSDVHPQPSLIKALKTELK